MVREERPPPPIMPPALVARSCNITSAAAACRTAAPMPTGMALPLLGPPPGATPLPPPLKGRLPERAATGVPPPPPALDMETLCGSASGAYSGRAAASSALSRRALSRWSACTALRPPGPDGGRIPGSAPLSSSPAPPPKLPPARIMKLECACSSVGVVMDEEPGSGDVDPPPPCWWWAPLPPASPPKPPALL